MEPVKVIFLNVTQEDYILACRAAKFLQSPERPEGPKDAILSYGDSGDKCFYVKRNKASITVRPC